MRWENAPCGSNIEGHEVLGQGAHSDIIVASAKAYINALNKAMDVTQRARVEILDRSNPLFRRQGFTAGDVLVNMHGLFFAVTSIRGVFMGQTTAEKIFAAHLRDEPFQGTKVLDLDRVLCHEITTPVAIADLEWRGKDRVFDASRIKAVIDHVTPAKDSKTALQAKILRDWARRHEIKDFFDVGRNGVCHAIFPEKGYIRPGFTVIMGDSHTCTHGAFGAFAAGVGTTDLEVGILKGVCAFREPKSIRVNLNGKLADGVYAKDVILFVIGQLGVNGATDRVIEFHGPIVEAMSMDARMTLCNMAIEAGGTCGICQPDMITVDYLWPFMRGRIPSKAGSPG